MKSTPDNLVFLDDLAMPHPPVAMRESVLAAARSAAVRPTPVTGWSTAAAFFAAQPGWTAALAGVLAAHLILSLSHDRAIPERPSRPRDIEVEAQPDLLRLPRIESAGFSNFAARIDGAPGEGGRS